MLNRFRKPCRICLVRSTCIDDNIIKTPCEKYTKWWSRFDILWGILAIAIFIPALLIVLLLVAVGVDMSKFEIVDL